MYNLSITEKEAENVGEIRELFPVILRIYSCRAWPERHKILSGV